MSEPACSQRVLADFQEDLDFQFFKILAEPARLELMQVLLERGEADIATISEGMKQDRSVVSRHLKAMLEKGFLRCRKEGRQCFYALDGSAIVKRLERILETIKQAMKTCC